VRTQMNAARTKGEPVQGFNYSTTTLLNRYLKGKTQLLYPEPHDVFPSDIIPGTDNVVLTEKVEQ
jgi:glucose-6-phosphate isomerase